MRPAKKATQLNRGRVVAAALKLARREGVDKLTVRQVAQNLGVTPMALYRHVSDKDELLSLTLEAFIEEADVIPDPALPWEEWIAQLARRMYRALISDSRWTTLFGTVRVGAQAARVTDAFVGRLTSAGFSTGQAVRAYFAVLQVVLGAVCLHSSMQAASGREQAEGELADITRAYLQWPTLDRLAVAPELDRAVRMEQIDIALPLLIAGLRRQLAGQHAPGPSAGPASRDW